MLHYAGASRRIIIKLFKFQTESVVIEDLKITQYMLNKISRRPILAKMTKIKVCRGFSSIFYANELSDE